MKRFTLRSVSLILAVVTVLLMAPAAQAYSTSSWAKAEVDAMAELELIPEDLMDTDLTENITRLDMCRIAVLSYERVTGETVAQPDTHPFTDTTDPDVEKAYAAGLVKGRTETTFCPDETLKRLDYFAFVSQFLTAVGYEPQESDYADLTAFSDSEGMPRWSVKHAQLAVGLGIVKGSGGKLSWQTLTTGEQALAMFHRAYRVVDPESAPPVQEPEEDLLPFPDASKYAMESLNKMDELGLIPNSVKYSSMKGSISRADMCLIAVNAYESIMGDAVQTIDNPFSDTEDPAIILANQLGLVNGYTDGTFKPDAPITRQEFFKVAVNFLNAIGYPYTDDEGLDMSEYPDADQLKNYAKAPARLLVSIGVVKGDQYKNLNPTAQIVSQEAIVIFCRVMDFMPQWLVNPQAPGADRPPVQEEPPVEEVPEEPPVEETPDMGQQVVDLALQYRGYRYTYGGKSPSTGFDCSGFVYYVYKQFGYNLRPGCTTQWYNLPSTVIPRSELQLGDLVFFAGIDSTPGDYDHVGIYIGDGQFIHASTSSTGVIISSLSESFYDRHYAGAKRALN